MAPDPRGYVCKLTDYGLTPLMEYRERQMYLCASPYTAPEVILNNNLDTAADVYALGILSKPPRAPRSTIVLQAIN